MDHHMVSVVFSTLHPVKYKHEHMNTGHHESKTSLVTVSKLVWASGFDMVTYLSDVVCWFHKGSRHIGVKKFTR